MEPVIEDCCISTLKPIEYDLFTAERKEIEGNVFTYYNCTLKVSIGPVRAGSVAEKVVVRMDLGTINVVTATVSFFGYVRLAVV
jgi:hypothetical protein